MIIQSDIAYSNAKLNLSLKENFKFLNNFKISEMNFFFPSFDSRLFEILKGCGCTAAFFPKTINQTESPPCSIYDHVTCVKDHLVAFNQSARAKCNCQKDCVHSEPVAIHIQYGLE